MGKIGIEAARPELHAAGGEGLNLFALGQGGAPDLPERIRADHFGAIAVDALGALGENSFAPALARIFIGKNMAGDGCGPEHIEVVNFAEQVLHFFEVVAPSLVLGGKEILDDVAEALDADAEGVECDLGAVAQGAVVEFPGCRPALESEMLEERAARAEAGGARGKRFAPVAPLLAVELFESGVGFEFLFALAGGQDFQQGLGRWIG